MIRQTETEFAAALITKYGQQCAEPAPSGNAILGALTRYSANCNKVVCNGRWLGGLCRLCRCSTCGDCVQPL